LHAVAVDKSDTRAIELFILRVLFQDRLPKAVLESSPSCVTRLMEAAARILRKRDEATGKIQGSRG